MDWFRSAQRLHPEQPPVLVTDLIEGESYDRLIQPGDRVERLAILDPILMRQQSRLGDLWRNLVKLAALPLQVLRLRRILRRYPGAVVHAHSTYYMVMAHAAKCAYVGTPQGSEILSRPYRSAWYRAFCGYAVRGAARITVDSAAMNRHLQELYGLQALVVQNGIDIDGLREARDPGVAREAVVSIRGITANYQIGELLEARNRELPGLPIDFCYPFTGAEYRAGIAGGFIAADRDHGRLARRDLYRLLHSAVLAVSVPRSDSSPRSVYEAIFCGCIVATTDAEWIRDLPACMRARLVVVDLAAAGWLRRALEAARTRCREEYVPSAEALARFDQKLSMKKIYDEVFPAVVCA